MNKKLTVAILNPWFAAVWGLAIIYLPLEQRFQTQYPNKWGWKA